MTSLSRRNAVALRAGDRSLKQAAPGVLNSEDIRLAYQEEHRLSSTEQIIRSGHPADREALRRQALARIEQYAGSEALQHLLPLYQSILERVDAAIIADAPRHLNYLAFCVERDERILAKAQAQPNNPFLQAAAIEASINRYRARIAEIEAALMAPASVAA
jgi:hypothetical protein